MAVLLAGASVAAFTPLGTGFLPVADEGGFVIDYITPAGMALEDTDVRLKRIDAILNKTPEVASYVRRTGSELGMFATQMNSGDVLVRLKPRGERHRSAEEIITELRDALTKAVPDTEIEFVQLLQDMLGDLEGNPDPIEVKIFGDDQEQLAELAEQVETRLGKIKGVVDMVGIEEGGPESTWAVDPIGAARIGLTVEQVADQLSAAWLGTVPTELRLNDRTIPVRVRYPDELRFNANRLGETRVRGKDGQLIPASALVTIEDTPGDPELMRENLRPMALVTARLEDRDLGSAVEEIKSALAAMSLPVGYTWEVGGQYDSQRKAFRELLLVSAIATMLVFLVLVIQFRGFVASAIMLRGCGPNRANSGSSWLRTKTLTESIWMSPIRSSTLRKWRRSTRPFGRGSAKPCAPSAMRRAVASETFSAATCVQSATVMVTELITTSVRGRSPRSVSTRCIASMTSSPLTT